MFVDPPYESPTPNVTRLVDAKEHDELKAKVAELEAEKRAAEVLLGRTVREAGEVEMERRRLRDSVAQLWQTCEELIDELDWKRGGLASLRNGLLRIDVNKASWIWNRVGSPISVIDRHLKPKG